MVGACIGAAVLGAVGGYVVGIIGGKVADKIYNKNMARKCPLCQKEEPKLVKEEEETVEETSPKNH